jgi:hypothetical protein
MNKEIKSPITEGRKAKVGATILTALGKGVIQRLMACPYQVNSPTNWEGCKVCPGRIEIKMEDGHTHEAQCFGHSGSSNESSYFTFRILDGAFIDKWEKIK